MLRKKPSLDCMSIYRTIIALLLLASWSLPSFAQTYTIDIADLGQKLVLSSVSTYEDKLRRVNASNLQEISEEQWEALEAIQINLGYTTANVWIKFRLTNSYSDPISALLDINFPLLDTVQIYKSSNEQSIPSLELSSGDNHVFDSRIIQHPNFVLPIKINPGETDTYYIKVASTTAIQTQILLWEENSFFTHYRHKAALNFFYFGLLFTTTLFNLLMFVYIKRRIFLYYSCYAASLALFIAAQYGVLFEFLVPSYPALHNWSQLIAVSMASSFAALFCREFLQFPLTSFYGKTLTYAAQVPIPILILSSFSGHGFSIQVCIAMNLIILVGCYGIGIHQCLERKRNARVFVFAWSFLFFGAVIYLLAKISVLPFNSFTNSALQTGSIFELITLAIVLVKNIHTEREARLSAQQTLVQESQVNAKLQSELIYSSTHNKTSGLPNRIFMESWLDNYLRQNKEMPCTLVFFYFSRMHEVGKTLGRDTEEQALKKFSKELNKLCQALNNIISIQPEENFYVSSMEGATHALLLKTATTNKVISEVTAVQRSINKPITVKNISIEPGVQVSMVESPEYGTQASQLIRHGSIALDAAKENKLQLSIYNSDIDPYSERRLALMSELRKALQSNGLTLYYQAILDVKEQKIKGAEALIRWHHTSHGLIMPDEFISIAEQTGLIHDLSIWVFNQAIQQLEEWIVKQPDFLLSINVCATNLIERQFIETINKELAIKPHLAQNLILEITESQMMQETQFALENLWALRELGIQIAIDDFGTGYSSLSYLRKLPASKLKIDKSFILNLEDDKQNQVLVQTAIDMAHNLGLEVVAEGVESERARLILARMNCDLCQGFHFSRPIPLEQFNNKLNES